MADSNIQNAFINGIDEIYTKVFTDGINDGVYYYPYVDNPNKGIYQEDRFKEYGEPLLLVARVIVTPEVKEQDVKEPIAKAVITVTFKSLRDNGLDTSIQNLKELKKGYLRYKDTYYEIKKIKPQSFIADTYLTYAFECEEDLEVTREGLNMEGD